MKQEKNTETKAESQNGQGIKDAFTGMYQTISWAQPKSIVPPVNPSTHLRSGQGGGFCIGKAPPGNARSPGAARGHPPENKAGPPGQAEPAPSPLSFGREGPGVSQKNKKYTTMNINILTMNQNFINKSKFNYLQTFNFFIMKKQILILAFLLVAVFASVTNSYGQLLPHTINCLPEDALHPVSGKEYTYQIDVPITPTLGDAWGTVSPNQLKYLWFVTQLDLNVATLDAAFITAGVLRNEIDNGSGTGTFIADASVDYAADGVTVPATADNALQITWKNITYDATKPVFVVISVTGNNGVCDPNNMKVFKIVPIIAFTVDIDNLTNTRAQHTPPLTATATAQYGDLYAYCISNIKTATWDNTNSSVIYDYDKDSLFYEVMAANWSDIWNMGVQITGIQPLETITVDWSKDKTFPNSLAFPTHSMTTVTAHAAVSTVLQYTSADNVTATASTGNVGAAGESIFIRVRIDHSVSGKASYQGLEDQEITLAIDGMTKWDETLTIPAFTIGDVSWDNATTSVGPPLVCAALATDGYANDKAYQDIKARPTIAVTVGTGATEMPTPGLAPVQTNP